MMTLIALTIMASYAHGNGDKNTTQAILDNITHDNDDFVQEHSKEDFVKMFDSQHPRVVVLGCADSRFHSNSIDKTPENDIFFRAQHR